jgi:phosphatidylserine/phosphatidylglycerophosphate/cardiolipin synthase-like enzyme
MRAVMAALLLLSALMPLPAHARGIPAQVRAQGSVQIAFTPWDDVEAMIIGAVGAARRQILVQAYSFSSRPIANALIDAHRRGVDVRVTADREQAFAGESSRVPDLVAAGIPVLIEVRYASAHSKVMVIDTGFPNQAVITGSYNWTWSAQNRNAENVLILRRNAEAARAYTANWWRHAADAVPYETVSGEASLPADARQRLR